MKWEATLESQLKLYKKMAVPTAIYENETWSVRKRYETRRVTAEFKLRCGVVQYVGTYQRNAEITGKIKHKKTKLQKQLAEIFTKNEALLYT